MYPVLPFAIGAMVGAAAVRLLKSVNLRGGLDKAQEKLRDATISSLDAIEHSSAGLKAKLVVVPEPTEAAPKRKAPVRRRSAPAAVATKPAATAKTTAAATPAKSAEATAARPRTRKKAATPVPPADTGDSA